VEPLRGTRTNEDEVIGKDLIRGRGIGSVQEIEVPADDAPRVELGLHVRPLAQVKGAGGRSGCSRSPSDVI
jgi:hypothetical protein